MIAGLDTFFLALVLLTAIAALTVRDLLAAVIVFGAFSFFSAMFFASLGAIDVAFTEAAVGAAITTVIFVTVIFRTERRSRPRPRPVPHGSRLATALALAFAGFGIVQATDGLPKLGDPDSPAARHVSPRYIESGPAETGAQNMVTGVLLDYRGYDTLGETFVIFTAGLACLLVLGAGTRAAGEGRS